MHPVQMKMARVALGLGVREIAALAKVSTDTIARLERGEPLKPRTLEALRATLEAQGLEFIEENGGGPGVRLAKALPPATSAQASKSAEAQEKAEEAVDRVLADVDADDAEKDRRKKTLTRVPKDVKSKGKGLA